MTRFFGNVHLTLFASKKWLKPAIYTAKSVIFFASRLRSLNLRLAVDADNFCLKMKQGGNIMASYHLRLKKDSKPDGSKINAIAHAEYVNREGKYQDYDTKREILEHLSGNFIFAPNKAKEFDVEYAALYYTNDYGSIAATKNGIELTRNPSRETMSIALLIADKSSNHSPLSLKGSKKFQSLALNAAVENNLDINFSDENLQQEFINRKELIQNEQRRFIESGGRYVRPNYRNEGYFDSGNEGTDISSKSKSDLNDLKGEQGTISDFTRRGFCVSTLSERNVVSSGENSGVLLSDNAHLELDKLGKGIYKTVRWDASGARRGLAKKTASHIVDEIINGKNTHIAEEHLAYINRDEIYKKKGGCVLTGAQLPKWAKGSARIFFAAADKYESAKNRKYLELELSLPNELSLEENKKILDEFLKIHLNNHYYAWAIHEKEGMISGEKHPHAHIMFSEREIDAVEKIKERKKSVYFKNASTKGPSPDHGAKKDKKWHSPDYIREIRADFAKIQNKILKENGFSITVDHRSLKEQQAQAIAEGDTFLANLLARVPEDYIGVIDSKQSNNKKIDSIIHNRSLVKTHREALYAAEKLKKEIKELELKDKSSDVLSSTDEFLKSVQFEEAKNTIDIIDELETDIIKNIEEVNLWKRHLITAEEAELRAKEEYMTNEEKNLFHKFMEKQGQIKNWNELLNSLRENEDSQKQTLEIQNTLEEKIEKYNVDLKILQKNFDTINARLSTEEFRKKIQQAAHNIMKENSGVEKNYTQAVQNLEKSVESLKQIIRDGDIQDDKKKIFTLKEMYNILRNKYFGYQKELKKLQSQEWELRKKIISAERARLMAEGVFLGGASRKLRERERKYAKLLQYFNNDTEKYQKDAAFLSTDAFKNLSEDEKFDIKSKLEKRNAELLKRKSELSEEENFIKSEKKRIDDLLSNHVNQEQIALITAGILRKNKGEVAKHDNIKAQCESFKNKISQTKIRMDAVKNKMNKEKALGYYKIDLVMAARIYKVSASRFSLKDSGGNPRTPLEAIADGMAGDKSVLPVIFHSTDIKQEKNWDLMTESEKVEEAYRASWRDI